VLYSRLSLLCSCTCFRQNLPVTAFRFWNTKLCEPFDAFLSELTNQAAACGFGLQKERMICDKIVFSVEQHLQQVLLLEPNLTLAKTIDICRTYEISVKNALDLQQASGQHQVHALSDQTRKHGRNFSTSTAQPECQFCGKYHQKGKTFCPAYGRFCANCKGRNHFQAKCKKPAMHQLTTAPTEPSNCTADNVYLHNVGRDHERQRTARMKEVPHWKSTPVLPPECCFVVGYLLLWLIELKPNFLLLLTKAL